MMTGDGRNINKSTLNSVGNGFNMLDAVANLKNAGFEQKKAEALVRMQYNLRNSHLATRGDIADVKKEIEELRWATKKDIADVKKEIEGLRRETKKDMKELEDRILLKMMIYLGGTTLTILTSLVTLAKLGLLTP